MYGLKQMLADEAPKGVLHLGSSQVNYRINERGTRAELLALGGQVTPACGRCSKGGEGAMAFLTKSFFPFFFSSFFFFLVSSFHFFSPLPRGECGV